MVCGFKIKSGMAETTAFVLNTESMSVVGDGTINLLSVGLGFEHEAHPGGGGWHRITGKFSIDLG